MNSDDLTRDYSAAVPLSLLFCLATLQTSSGYPSLPCTILVHLRHLLLLVIPRRTFLEHKSGGSPPPLTCVRPRPTPSQPGPQDAQDGEAPSRGLFHADYRTTLSCGKNFQKVQELKKMTALDQVPKVRDAYSLALRLSFFTRLGVFCTNCTRAQTLSSVWPFVTSWTVWLARVFHPWSSPG